MTTRRSSATDPGKRLVAALADRDFRQFAGVLTADVRMRALIPPGLVEVSGAEVAAAKFSSWFGDAEELELVRSGSDTVADRLHVFYQLRVKKPGDVSKVLEQHLFCAYDDGRVTALDLVCSGFRPEAGAPRTCQLKEGRSTHPPGRARVAPPSKTRRSATACTLVRCVESNPRRDETTGAGGSRKRRH